MVRMTIDSERTEIVAERTQNIEAYERAVPHGGTALFRFASLISGCRQPEVPNEQREGSEAQLGAGNRFVRTGRPLAPRFGDIPCLRSLLPLT